jgi:voltage-gated potassium channel
VIPGIRALVRTLRDPELRGLATLVAALMLAGTVFYHLVEHWSLLNSLYFSVTSLLTVGFGDFVPTTAAAKIFTILYTLIGVGVLVSFVSAVAGRAEGIRAERIRRRRPTEPGS